MDSKGIVVMGRAVMTIHRTTVSSSRHMADSRRRRGNTLLLLDRVGITHPTKAAATSSTGASLRTAGVLLVDMAVATDESTSCRSRTCSQST